MLRFEVFEWTPYERAHSTSFMRISVRMFGDIHIEDRERFATPARSAPNMALEVSCGSAGQRRVMATAGRQTERPVGAQAYLPEAVDDLDELRRAAAQCHGCDLYRPATQTVFGEGPPGASLLMVGEQPGDQEDRQGEPFVGPAGHVLDQAMERAGIDRRQVYVTNAVKHFKWVPQGSRRLHKTPSAREVAACRPWLHAEIAAVRPRIVLCLGAVAAKALFGPSFLVSTERGKVHEPPDGPLLPGRPLLAATVHPSSILRAGQDRHEQMERFVADLAAVATRLGA
ncbi:MAG: uracil-DNA glycosylase [Acidimicrobiaceae bacterium]|nr:uracil-DNA glycosylase [Acidimicrobiaceae bacterium]